MRAVDEVGLHRELVDRLDQTWQEQVVVLGHLELPVLLRQRLGERAPANVDRDVVEHGAVVGKDGLATDVFFGLRHDLVVVGIGDEPLEHRQAAGDAVGNDHALVDLAVVDAGIAVRPSGVRRLDSVADEVTRGGAGKGGREQCGRQVIATVTSLPKSVRYFNDGALVWPVTVALTTTGSLTAGGVR